MAFPFDDIGGDTNGNKFPANYSYTEIIAAASESGLVGTDPLLRDTSDLRPFSQGFSYHFTGNAVDFGDDQENGSPQQTEFASWVWQHYKLYTLELIHLNADGSYYAVKFGEDVGYDYYGDATMQEHRNHVHWAITNDGLKQGGPPDIMAQLPSIDTSKALNMAAPAIRTAQGLLMARGGMIEANNVNHPVFTTVVKWFQQQTGLQQDGIIGPATWQRLIQPLNGK